jgi:hypothetical protein
MITTRTRAFNEQRANISFVRAAIVAGAGIDVRFALVALFGSSSAPISRRSNVCSKPRPPLYRCRVRRRRACAMNRKPSEPIPA